MSTERKRDDDHTEAETDDEGFALSPEDADALSRVTDPTLRKHLLGIRKGIARKEKQAAAGPPPAAQSEEKPFQLPLLDEEELAAITNPRERERLWRHKIDFYKQRPEVYAYYMDRSEKIKAERAKPVLLEPWSDDRRAAPNIIYRSALFPALNSQTRKFIKDYKVCSVGGLDVTFTGEQFDQSDLDVYLEVLNFAKAVPLGQPVRFSAYALLKALGRCTGKSDHQWLHSVLIRLRGGTVQMVTEKARYFGGLIEGGIRDEITKHYDITINPSYAKFFGFGLWSSIDIAQRRQLAQKSTAKALHAYYSTHTDPAPHRYETLAGVIGLENKNPRDVKAKLIKAHGELKRIGFLLDYEAGPDKIAVKATMTPGQQQHLTRKIAKATKSRRTP